MCSNMSTDQGVLTWAADNNNILHMSGSKKRGFIAHVEGIAATCIGQGAHMTNVPPKMDDQSSTKMNVTYAIVINKGQKIYIPGRNPVKIYIPC
jgi:hypothetical protein